jgi:hypothetical protein
MHAGAVYRSYAVVIEQSDIYVWFSHDIVLLSAAAFSALFKAVRNLCGKR